MPFPIDLGGYQPLTFSLAEETLGAAKRQTLTANLALARDSLIFFTALANAKGLGGHTGGAYDIAPEMLIIDAFIKGGAPVVPIYFDEAGHRVAMQYLMAALNGYQKHESLLHYREAGYGLYGHPEREDKAGVFFSSGRLGHMWSYVNGVAEANPGKSVVMFGSDGAQMEGNDAEAARYAVARGLNVKLLLDDNNVTIAGHPKDYMPGYDLTKTLNGHGLTVNDGDGEDLNDLYHRIRQALMTPGPVALVNRRQMAPSVPGIEGSPKGHDVIAVNLAVEYLKARGRHEAVAMLEGAAPIKNKITYQGSTPETGKCRDEFGKIICGLLAKMDKPEEKVLVVDSDLEGSCGLHHIHKQFPGLYVVAGIMERNNYSVAAGFGSEPGRQGIFGTFAAFQEMLISEITMARLNGANVLAHFSHSGVDDMADNTCHFGINNFFADNALAEGDTTRLYFPADTLQLKAMLNRVFDDPGLRFIYSTRSATPFILGKDGEKFFGEGYVFEPGKDELIREGKVGYIVSYGEMLYRALDAVETMRAAGLDVGLVNKPTLNVADDRMLAKIGAAKAVLVVESQNEKTGLGSRFGTWLLERGLSPKLKTMGSERLGCGGLGEQISNQNLTPQDIAAAMHTLVA
ncbi:MAG: transketolase [Desulfobulbaceae bacterium]|jgi:transketolase C-terminal domain/subunit/transketolase N-terminal domain/subunit|nr:transketolase [Desulfobulbaceae bacterium]